MVSRLRIGWRAALAALTILPALMFALAAHAAGPPVVLAAASLQEALGEAADAWAARGHPRPLLSFAASSALARQIEQRAPADLFVSADEGWVTHLVKRGHVRSGTVAIVATNRLALIAPRARRPRLRLDHGFPIAQALGSGRLAVADPSAVPAGRYAREALTALGVWRSVAGRLAPGENVRAALKLVERGETPLGIVYATDAMASGKVALVGLFPANLHRPIRYPVAELKAGRSAHAAGFRLFLLGRDGRAIFRRHGFAAP